MVTIKIILHTSLKKYLPTQANGRMKIDLPDGTQIRELSEKLSLPDSVICAVNDLIEPDRERYLMDGDVVRFMRLSAGG